MDNYIGIMQGRMLPQVGDHIQSFPHDNWEHEINLIENESGYDYVEWVLDDYYNPLCLEPEKVLSKTEGLVRAVNLDYLMKVPVFKHGSSYSKKHLENCFYFIDRILQPIFKAGINLVTLPMVDNGSLEGMAQMEFAAKVLHRVSANWPDGFRMGIESDLPPSMVRTFLAMIDSEKVGVTWDIGNSASMGYDSFIEMAEFGRNIFHVHIKDRMFRGPTVPLGTGHADIPRAIKNLRHVDYKGRMTIQAARRKNPLGDCENDLRKVKEWISD